MLYEDIIAKLKPCPFCGSLNLKVELSRGGKITTEKADHASVMCRNCFCSFEHVLLEHEHYEHIQDDIYRKVPTKYAEDVLIDTWNRREE